MSTRLIDAHFKRTLNRRSHLLRKNSTDAENKLWFFLQDRRLQGYKFRRQYIIDSYIVDFVCHHKKLIIELDGGQHLDVHDYDEKRRKFLENEGYQVLRFWNDVVFTETESVLEVILEALEK